MVAIRSHDSAEAALCALCSGDRKWLDGFLRCIRGVWMSKVMGKSCINVSLDCGWGGPGAFHQNGKRASFFIYWRTAFMSSSDISTNCNPIPAGRLGLRSNSGWLIQATRPLQLIVLSFSGMMNIIIKMVSTGRWLAVSMNTPPVLRLME